MKMIEVASSAKKYNHTVFIFRAVSNFDKLLMHIIQVGLANYKYVGSSRDNFIQPEICIQLKSAHAQHCTALLYAEA